MDLEERFRDLEESHNNNNEVEGEDNRIDPVAGNANEFTDHVFSPDEPEDTLYETNYWLSLCFNSFNEDGTRQMGITKENGHAIPLPRVLESWGPPILPNNFNFGSTTPPKLFKFGDTAPSVAAPKEDDNMLGQQMMAMARPGMPPMPAASVPRPQHKQSFKYIPTVRNIPQQMTLQEQKQILGERLFPLIQRMFPDLAGRSGEITVIILDSDQGELIHMLGDPDYLKLKVKEVASFLQAHHGVMRMHLPSQLPPQEAVAIHLEHPLIASLLAAKTPQEQKQIVDSVVLPVIHKIFPDLATMSGKIIGILVKIDNKEVVHMLENPLPASNLVPPEVQIKLLGDRLFPVIHSFIGRLAYVAGSLTGILMNVDKSKLEDMMKKEGGLQSKVEVIDAKMKGIWILS